MRLTARLAGDLRLQRAQPTGNVRFRWTHGFSLGVGQLGQPRFGLTARLAGDLRLQRAQPAGNVRFRWQPHPKTQWAHGFSLRVGQLGQMSGLVAICWKTQWPHGLGLHVGQLGQSANALRRVCVCVWLCACVREREREGHRNSGACYSEATVEAYSKASRRPTATACPASRKRPISVAATPENTVDARSQLRRLGSWGGLQRG